MADLEVIEPIPRLDPIIAIGKDELVEGGIDGAANRPIIALANQVAYVMDRTYPKSDIDEKIEETSMQTVGLINAVGVGNKAYLTYADMVANSQNIPANEKVTVTNDPDKLKNGDYQYNGSVFSRSQFDLVEQARKEIKAGIGEKKNLTLINRSAALNGATIDVDYITIPAGQTGANSYIAKLIDFANSTKLAGKKITISAYFDKSANFADNGGVLAHNVVAVVDGVSKADQQVENSIIVENISSTRVKVTAEYIIEAAQALSVGISGRIASNSLAVTAQVSVQALSNVGISADATTISEIGDNYNESKIIVASASIDRLSGMVDKVAEIELDDDRFILDLRNLNGANLITNGLTFPAGQAGLTSFIRAKVPFIAIKDNLFVGKISAVVSTSDDFFEKFGLININIAKYATAGGAITVNEGKNSSNLQKINKNKYVVSATFDSNAGFEQYALWFQMLSNSDTAAERFIAVDKLYFSIVESKDSVFSGSSTILNKYQLGYVKEIAIPDKSIIQFFKPNYIKTIKVKPHGGGDFLTIQAAIAAHGGGTDFFNRVKYEIYEGIYEPYNVYIPAFTDLIGVGKRENIHIKCHMPPDTDPDILATSQPLWMNYTSKIKGLMITAKNARYPLHSDSTNSTNKAVIEVDDCYIEHLGNDEARAWQAENGGDPARVRTQHYALGGGSHADMMLFSRRTIWKSSNRPFYVHNQREFTAPSYVEIDGGAIICTGNDSDAILFMSLGSGQVCNVVIKNNPIVRGRMVLTASSSLSTVVDNQVADQNAEIDIEVTGNSIPFLSDNYGKCLVLKSIQTEKSSVRVSGTAADAIFGKFPDYQDGASNLEGLAISRYMATATNPNVLATIGTRLGDCTSEPKVLNIVFDGNVNKTLNLSLDYRAMSDSAIVTALNGALNDPGRIFSLGIPYLNKAHARQTAHEAYILNTSTVAILKGAPVRMTTSIDSGEMAADTVGFMGVALENILPGNIGRIQKSGYICRRFIKTGHSFLVGDFATISQTSTFIKSTSGPLKCVNIISNEAIFEILN